MQMAIKQQDNKISSGIRLNAHTDNHPEVDHVRQVLSNMSRLWDKRAQVKLDDPVSALAFDRNRLDFLPELLPFSQHPSWQSASDEMKSTVLSYAWILYNWKTIYIETDIIAPVCNDILFGRIPGANNEATKSSIVQTLVDESYHTLMALNACKIVLQSRGLPEVKVSQFNLVKHMQAFSNTQNADWKKLMVQYATATVSETLISDYLKDISESKTIQPLCQITADAHRKDELAHSNIFSQMLKSVYYYLNQEQRDFLLNVMRKAVEWFSDKEFSVWEEVLAFIDFPKYQSMIADCKEAGKINTKIINYSGVISLLNNLDINVNFDNFLTQ